MTTRVKPPSHVLRLERPLDTFFAPRTVAGFSRAAQAVRRPWPLILEWQGSRHDGTASSRSVMVTGCGRICFRGRKVNLSHIFAGQNVGVTAGRRAHLARHLHAVRFGLFRRETCRPEPIDDPCGPKVLPVSSE